MREEEIDGGAQARLGRRSLVPLAEAHSLDHLRLVVSVLHGPHGPVREFEPVPSILIPSARSQYTVKRLATGIRMWGHALTPLERPQIDDGRDVALNGANTERLSDRDAINAHPFLVPGRPDLAI
jgi:hypothetical protein